MKTIGKAKVFEAAISRPQAQTRLIDDLLSLFGGDIKPFMARLVDTGRLMVDDIKDVEQMLREHRERELANASPIGRSHQGKGRSK